MATRTTNRGYTRPDRDDFARIEDTLGIPLDEIDADVQLLAETIAEETDARTAALAAILDAISPARQVGVIRMTGRPIATRGWLLLGSPAPRRTDYPLLLDALTVQQSCTTTARSRTLTVTDSTALRIGWKVEGTSIPAGTTVAAVVDATTITLSLAATASARGVAVRWFPHSNGDGATTFDLPPADRVPVGASAAHPLGSTWGADGHQHAGNIPSHTHGIGADGNHAHAIGADGNHSHTISGSNLGTRQYPTGSGQQGAYVQNVSPATAPIDQAGSHSHGGATGSGGSHSHGGATASGGSHSHGGATAGPSATAFTTDSQSSAQPSVAWAFEICTGV